MGECGCAQDVSEYRIEGADGFHYGIGLYAGCDYCGTPLGLDIFRYNDDAVRDVELDSIPEAKPPGDDYYAALGHPIIDPRHLIAAFQKHMAEDGLQPNDLDERTARSVLQDAFYETQAEWHRMRAPNGGST